MNWFKISVVATVAILLGLILFVVVFAALHPSRSSGMRVGEVQKVRFQSARSL